MGVFNRDIFNQNTYNQESYWPNKFGSFLQEVLRRKSSIFLSLILVFINFILMNIFTFLGIILGAILGAMVRYTLNTNLVDVFFAALGSAFSLGYLGLMVDELVNNKASKLK